MNHQDAVERTRTAASALSSKVREVQSAVHAWKVLVNYELSVSPDIDSKLEFVRSLSHAVFKSNLGALPDELLGNIARECIEIEDLLQNFPNPSSAEDRSRPDLATIKLTEFSRHVDGFIESSRGWLGFFAFSRLQDGDQETVRAELDEVIGAATSDRIKIGVLLADAEKQLAAAAQRSALMIKEAGTLASMKLCAQYESSYSADADKLNREAMCWGGGAIIFALAAIAMLLNHPFPTQTELDSNHKLWHLVNYASFRLVVLGICATGIAWCGRMMRAARHLRALNTHRSNALRTFEAFVAAAEGDETVKKAIILEACKTIFGNLPSGYIDQPGGKEDDPKGSIDLAKALVDLAKAGKP